MNAARLLETAQAAGLSFEVDGNDLIVEGDSEPPPELIAELRQRKAELMAVLAPQDSDAAPSPQSAAVDADDLEVRAAIIEESVGVLRIWAQGFAALSMMSPPAGFLSDRWQRIIDAAGRFMDRWANEAAAAGWSDLDLFGCNPDRPDARFDAMGLVLLLDRAQVIGVDGEGATLRAASGSELRFGRRDLPADTVPLWELVTARDPG